MDDILAFLKANWVWLGPIVSMVLGSAGWLINRRVTRASRKADAITQTVETLSKGLDAIRGELDDLRARFGILRQAIKETTPDQGAMVFRREQELLEARARKESGG